MSISSNLREEKKKFCFTHYFDGSKHRQFEATILPLGLGKIRITIIDENAQKFCLRS